MLDNEDTRLIKRTKILLNQSNLLLNRLDNRISLLKNRITTFFTIMIATISLEIAVVQILFNSEEIIISSWGYVGLIGPFLGLIFISGIFLYDVFKVKKYRDTSIFENERFEELTTCSEKDLVLDFLYFTKSIYEFNKEIYDNDIKSFKRSFYLYIIANAYLFIGLIILIS